MAATVVVTVEVAFNGSTFVDISQYVRRAQVRYGRKKLLDDTFAGTSQVTVDNRTNWLTPGHSDSTYGATQLINREIRIRSTVTGGSDSYPSYLWRGFVTDLDYRAGQSTSTVTISSVDGFEKLAKTQILDKAFAEAFTGVRVAEILNFSGVDYPDETTPANDRDIDLGYTKAIAASGVTANTLDYIQKLTRTESGRFLVNHAGTPSATNKGGVLNFYARNASSDDHGITISDSVTLSTGSAEAADLELEWGSELLFNAYQFTDGSGTVRTGSQAASIAKYGERVRTMTLLSDGAATTEAGDFLIGLYDEPTLRVASVAVDIDSASTATATKLLHLHVNSSLALSYLPPGSSTTLAGTYLIEGVHLDIGVRDMATNASRIRATYSTAPADTTGYWELGDAVLGALPTILAPPWLDTSSWRLADPDLGVLPTQLG